MLICKNDREEVYISIRRAVELLPPPPPNDDILIDDNDYKNVFI
jgi:hypothetical protein